MLDRSIDRLRKVVTQRTDFSMQEFSNSFRLTFGRIRLQSVRRERVINYFDGPPTISKYKNSDRQAGDLNIVSWQHFELIRY